MRTMLEGVALVVGLACVAGCSGDDDAATDSGTHDTGVEDAGDAATNTDAATDQDAAVDCTLGHALQFGQGGGFINSSTTAQLSNTALNITRSSGSGDTMCTPPLPMCGGAGVDLGDLAADLADPDVIAAFALSEAPTYGAFTPDSGVFFIITDDGHMISSTGRDCGDALPPDCTNAPAAVAKLVDDLRAMFDAAVADPACVDL